MPDAAASILMLLLILGSVACVAIEPTSMEFDADKRSGN